MFEGIAGATGASRKLVLLGVVTLMSACAGSAGPTPPPAPTRDRTAADLPLRRTDEAPGQVVTIPKVMGVDLDTVRAGEFDQGKMWTFEHPPVEYFSRTYGFRPDDAWFERARLGALRIPSCSASFVSPNGLVMTNHHCAREFVTQVQREGETLLDDGFFATNLADEREVEDFEADRLMDIVDVTSEVNSQLDGIPPGERAEARESLLEEIKARILGERGGEEAGIVVEMISLYNGGLTSAYVFRRYTRAKLVAAPELQLGFFGGDPDNFTYPRYALDFSFFRLYDEDGNPLESDPYFPFSREGVSAGEPVFIVGNPGSTSRLQTVAELDFRRDVSDRAVLDLLRSRMAVLDAFIRENPEVSEQLDLRNEYFGLSNSEKAYSGQLKGLGDPVILARRRDTERRFQAAIEADPGMAARYGGSIGRMAELQAAKREYAPGFGAFLALSADYLASSTLHRALVAFQIMNARGNGVAPEDTEDLLDELREIPQLPASLDQALMVARFEDFRNYYGDDSPLVAAVLQGRSPEEVASRVNQRSVLADSARAVGAVEGGNIDMADPALAVVMAYLPAFIEFQQGVFSVFPEEETLAADLGRARFAVYGTDVPPDATFSLRIADGVVEGYPYNGTVAPVHTTFFGMYDRHYSHEGEADWALPARWLDPPAGFDLRTPLDFVSTVDIIGGNSGSPVLNRKLEAVGVVFDGNIESLPGDYIYLPTLNRSVTVDVRAILEALDDIYDMDRLVLELTTGTLVPTEREADARRP